MVSSIICPSATQEINILHGIVEQLSIVLDIPVQDVDITSSFIQLGGHSLYAYSFQKACLQRGIVLPLSSILQCQSIEDLLGVAAVTETTNPYFNKYLLCGKSKRKRSEQCNDVCPDLSRKEQLSQAKRVAIKSIKESSWPTASTVVEIELTEMQLALLFGSAAKPGTNIISFYETYQTDYLSKVRDAWQHVINNETIFRAKLELVGNQGKLIQCKETICEWNEVIATDRGEYERLMESSPPSLLLANSFTVITVINGNKHLSTVIWSFHHGLMDGFSAQLVYNKFRAVLAGQPIQPSPLLSDIMPKIAIAEDLSTTTNWKFWQRMRCESQLECPKILLPMPKKDAPSEPISISTLTGQAHVERLSHLAQQLNVSLASIYHAAWALALSAFTNSERPCFGAVFSGRNLPVDSIEQTVGLFIKTLPLWVDVSINLDVHKYLKMVFQSMLDLSDVQTSKPEDGFTRDFETLLSMQFSMKPSISDKGPKPSCPSSFRTIGDIPITVCIWEDGSIVMDYHSHRYDAEDMNNLFRYFLNSTSLLSGTNFFLKHLYQELMPVPLRNMVMQQSNAISEQTCNKSILKDVVTMFEDMARSHASLPALEKDGEIITYQELDMQATHVATHLQDIVTPEEVVCVHADRSLNWIIGIYAVLKAGAVYSAVDPELPSTIRNTNFHIAKAKVYLASSANAKEIGPNDCSFVLSVEELLQKPIPGGKSLIGHRTLATPSLNAYVCFTSGSTGQPKGVVCTHAGLVAFHQDEERRMYASPGVRIGQSMSPAFDGSIHEIFSALSYGATLVLSNADDPFAHLSSVHSACLTPSIASILEPDNYPDLQNLYLVGEPLSQRISDAWSAKKRLYNMYGPTECTCGATTQRMFPDKPVTIGPPNSSVRLYIVDCRGNLCPPRVTGEICLAGVQVARGYIGRPQETRKKFVKDPFFGASEEMMYCTGDRGYINQTGQVECLGRDDRLVKLRGFRLDLNDLETRVVNGIRGVTAVAMTKKGDNLVAMVKPASVDVVEVTSKMADLLPPYAMPRNTIAVDEFPRTQIGKLDYKAMSSLFDNNNASISPVTNLLTPTEHAVAEIWSEVLGTPIDQLNNMSCFQSIGGHSILQLLLVDRLKETFSIDISLRGVIQSTTLKSLAKDIDLLKRDVNYDDLQLPKSPGSKPLGRNVLSSLELDWWHRYQYAGILSTSSNVTHAASLDMTIVDLDKLAKAWDLIIDRHEMLHSRYVRGNNGKVSRVYACRGTKVRHVDNFHLQREANRPFDLSTESPIRVIISQTRILVSISHIICDYNALSILLQEVASVYNNKSLNPVESHFPATTVWSTPAPLQKLDFWRSRLQKLPALLFPTRTSYAGISCVFETRPSLYQSITDYCEKHDFTLHQISLAAVALVLTMKQEDTDIILGGPFLNRGTRDLTTVGNFVEPLPIQITHMLEDDISEETSDDARTLESSFLQAVRSSSQQAIDNAINWSQLVSLLSTGQVPSLPDYPLIEVMVTVHDERRKCQLSEVDIPGAVPINTWTSGAKFKLMFEFRAIKGMPLMLRIEADDVVVGGREKIEDMATLLDVAFEGLVQGCDVAEIKRKMRGLDVSHDGRHKDLSAEYFGKPMIS